MNAYDTTWKAAGAAGPVIPSEGLLRDREERAWAAARAQWLMGDSDDAVLYRARHGDFAAMAEMKRRSMIKRNA